ncbi:hypothetical protein HYH03_008800 [Edaphochlamys debaryana]|uniref:Uncharacterized protein n=1 Tax=Edaphochlamys debaryana TaxID=47281 RepID=A0A835XZI6_9CHLO|nr:hypothetical protein HYH03_008800 [Edaphochlamys debaryana]|eukprot:KAG2492885.1 hypothetical protein HYH03_008800 [Edaphochlamys debaryana]
MLATQNMCVFGGGGLCRLNPSFLTSLAAPTTDTAKLIALTEAMTYKCGTYTDADSCNSDSRCSMVGGTCRSNDWGDARWYKGKGYCEGSLVDKQLGCLGSTSKDSCTGGCAWKTVDELSAVLARNGSPSEAAEIKRGLYMDILGLSIPGIEAQKNSGACTAAVLWSADFDAIVAKGVRANNGSQQYDYRVIFRAIQGDLVGNCSGAGTSLSRQADCTWARSNPGACASVGSYCEYRWISPSSGFCRAVDPLIDPQDPFYKAYREASNTCYKVAFSDCLSTGGPINLGVTPWETLLTTLPSITGGATEGTPSPAPKPKPTSSPGKKETAAPPPRRSMRSYPPFRRAPPIARKL